MTGGGHGPPSPSVMTGGGGAVTQKNRTYPIHNVLRNLEMVSKEQN